MNVVLYFKRIRDVRSFSIISKNCHEAILCMKINPIMNYAKKLKYRKTYSSLMYRLFPNIQTIQVPDLSYPIPNELLLKLTYIRILHKIVLTPGIVRSKKIENCPPTYEIIEKGKRICFHYDESNGFLLKKGIINKETNDYHSIGNEMYHETNEIIINKIQELDIYSYETANFLIQHFEMFKCLRTLYLISEREIKTRKEINYDYNLRVLKLLSKVKSITFVNIHSITNHLNNEYIAYMKSNSYINFSITFYSFSIDENEQYSELQYLNNVKLYFNCFDPNILLNGYTSSIENFTTQLNELKQLSFPSQQILTSYHLSKLLDVIFQNNASFETLIIQHLNMNSKMNLSILPITNVQINFFITSPLMIDFSTNLKVLILEIKQKVNTTKEIPYLNLNNASLSHLSLKGFKYELLQTLSIHSIPTQLLFDDCCNMNFIDKSNDDTNDIINDQIKATIMNCSKISIQSNNSNSIMNLLIDTSEHIFIQSKVSYFTNCNEVITNNIEELILINEISRKFMFTNILDLNLTIPSSNVNINVFGEMQSFTLNNQNHFINPEMISIEHIQPLFSFLEIPLKTMNLNSITEPITFKLPNTIRNFSIKNCSNLFLDADSDCFIHNFQYSNNKNCQFTNISINHTASKELYNELIDNKVRVKSYTLTKRYVPPNPDYDSLFDNITIIGDDACKRLLASHITLPNSIIELHNKCFSYCMNLKSIELSTSLKIIQSYAFIDCKKLLNITFPDSLQQLGCNCFERCVSLTQVIFSPQIKQFGNNVFKGCNSLTNIQYKPTCKNLYQSFIPTKQIKSITLPEFTQLRYNSLKHFMQIKEIQLPTTLIEIEPTTFHNLQ
ncbi:hypothetical protein QTN25_004578 [Entamoeba marina]